jgi:hypothetical protein
LWQALASQGAPAPNQAEPAKPSSVDSPGQGSVHSVESSSLHVATQQTACVSREDKARCPNVRCTYEGMDGERYRCDLCGYSYFLDYDEMR